MLLWKFGLESLRGLKDAVEAILMSRNCAGARLGLESDNLPPSKSKREHNCMLAQPLQPRTAYEALP